MSFLPIVILLVVLSVDCAWKMVISVGEDEEVVWTKRLAINLFALVFVLIAYVVIG